MKFEMMPTEPATGEDYYVAFLDMAGSVPNPQELVNGTIFAVIYLALCNDMTKEQFFQSMEAMWEQMQLADDMVSGKSAEKAPRN